MTFQSFPFLSNSVSDVNTIRRQRLGTRVAGHYGDNGDSYAEFVYIKAGAALTANKFYELPVISGTDAYVVDAGLTTTLVSAIAIVGGCLALCVPVSTLAVGEFGWAFVKGSFTGSGVNTIPIGSGLYTTATAGSVGDTATAGLLRGTIATSDPGSGPANFTFYAANDLYVERLS